ncbi:MAG: DNA polymerase III subunit delta [Bacilli bacterium]|nr:DNA polymerase III subunit delta [Bacilli bacterium]
MVKTICKNYLIETTDAKTKELRIKDLIGTSSFKSYDINTYDLSEDISFDKVMESIDTYNLLSDNKVIIVENIEHLKDDRERETLSKYLDNPKDDILLIMTTKKIDNKLKIFKLLKDKVKVLNDEIDPTKYIKDNLEEYKMSDKDIALLIKYKNKDITAIDNELCKLKAYKLNNKEITKEDIENIVIKAKEEEDQLLFSLVDSIITKNKKLALEDLNSLKEQAIDPFSIIALLDNQLRILLQTYILREEGKKEKEITDILKIHPYRVKLALNNSYNYTRKEIENTILELAKLDYNIKSGREDKSLALDMFIINLKDKH